MHRSGLLLDHPVLVSRGIAAAAVKSAVAALAAEAAAIAAAGIAVQTASSSRNIKQAAAAPAVPSSW